MKEAYSVKEIAEISGKAITSIWRQAEREDWPSRTRKGKGGGKEFPAPTLPEEIRLKIVQVEEACKKGLATCSTPTPTLATANVTDRQKAKALAKVDLVAIYTEWMEKAGHGAKGAARKQFISAYKGGAWPRILEILGYKVSWQSIERWKVSLRKTSTAVSLVDTRGVGNCKRTVMTEQHMELLLRMVLQPNAPTISSAIGHAIDAMTATGLSVPSDNTMRRFLKQWQETNFGTWVYTREGKKAWNDKASFFIERDYSKINVGDILVADGHVLNFETINPETGKAKRMELVMWYDMASNCPVGWEIMPTENTQSIASSFRRAVITLGKYPIIAYLDNGKAFRSKYFNGVDFKQTGIGGLFQELGIHTIFAWPYHGQSKTVERFFGTLHELEQWLPSYVGNNILAKPPRMNRGEATHRKAWEAAGGRPLTIEETHLAVVRWIDKYINTPQRGHLNGKCPAEVFMAGRGPGVDENGLRHLMMAKHITKVTNAGIRLLGNRYYAPELHSRTHSVQIRYDIHDLDRILVYSEDGKRLICEAPRMGKVHPAADLLGSAKDQEELRRQLSLRKGQEKDASSIVRGVLDDAMADQQKRMQQIEAEKQELNPASNVSQPLPQSKVTSIEAAREKARIERETTPSYTPPEQKADILTEFEKYEYLFGIAYKDKVTLREADAEWMEYYESTEEYANTAAELFEKRKKLYANWA